MDAKTSTELSATCSSLGYFDRAKNEYYTDSNTLETVKDLIRYLRRDGATHHIRRHLGETKVLKTDLIPLLISHSEDTDIFDVITRLLANLTQPALILWDENVPTEKEERKHYLQIEEHLRFYKQAFADQAIWLVLSKRIKKILSVDPEERDHDNGVIVERVLLIIRNILCVAADPDDEKRSDNDANVHDQILWALHASEMLDIILYLTTSTKEKTYYMHILGILSYMFREQTASELANVAVQRSETEKLQDEAQLLAIRHLETKQRAMKVKKYTGARHSHFGGTFVVKSMKSISDNELIYHKPLNNLDSLNFDVDKHKTRIPKNRLPMQNTNNTSCDKRRSAVSLRMLLKEFCNEFLNGSYNVVMYHVKETLVRAKSQHHDESYYLWALRFFMEFNRCYKFQVKLVSETMSTQTFHFVQQQMENYFDMLSSDKKKLHLWSRRLHIALLTYRELLLTICAMDKSTDQTIKDSANVIKSNIFYVLEYRELILTLLVTFDELKESQSYLIDLIETQHIFMKMFQSYCGGKDGCMRVQGKSKGPRRKKNKKVVASIGAAQIAQEFNLDAMWDEAAPQLSIVLEGHLEIPTDVVPFDACSDVPIDEQKSTAMLNIQRKLRDHDFENAIGLLRAAREVWPENDCFGNNNMAAEEEFLALRDIFSADLGENVAPAPSTAVAETEIDEHEDEEDDEEDEQVFVTEKDIKFDDFAKRLAHPKIVSACGMALVKFDKHSTLTNHCIIKLLHRIAFDCKMSIMIFQVSIFRTFQKIYECKELPQFKELVKFATYVMRQFQTVAAKNGSVFMESLFWKSVKDANDIEDGYGTYGAKSLAASKAWTECEEDELRRLFMEHQKGQLQDDVVDWIVNNLIDNTKTRRAVLKKLKEMYLLTDYKAARKSGAVASGKIPRQWGEEEEAQLQELYEEFKDAMDPLGCIMHRLDVNRPKNRIIEKLMVMGLVQDKKELYKKRGKKFQQPDVERGPDIDSESENDEVDQLKSSSSSQHPSSGKNRKQSFNPTTRKSQKGKNRKSSRHVQVSPRELVKMLISLVDEGMSSGIEWVKECFADTAEDIANDPDDNEEAVPLIPILDDAIAAMESLSFQKLLKALGVTEPSDEQETYWRIPHSITKNLTAHCELLSKALDKTLILPEDDIIEKDIINEDIELSDDEELKENPKSEDFKLKHSNDNKSRKNKNKSSLQIQSELNENKSFDALLESNEIQYKPKKKKIQRVESSGEEDDQINKESISAFDELLESNESKPKKKKIQRFESSDEEESALMIVEEDEDIPVLEANSEAMKSTNKIINRFESSDDEDSSQINKLNDAEPNSEEDKENTGINITTNEIEESKRLRSASDSDNEKPKPKRSRVIISDEEDD